MIYDFKCPKCLRIHDAYLSVDEVGDTNTHPVCLDCDTKMKRIYSAGLLHRSKGIFPRTLYDIGDTPVVANSFDHETKLLKERGLVRAMDVKSQESVKKLQDKYPKAKRTLPRGGE